MRKKLLILFVCCATLLFGCGGVSQEEYDSLTEEKNELDKELTSLKSDYEEIDKLYKQSVAEKAEEVEADMILATPKAWATTSFGDDCIVFAENDQYLQCISMEKYTLSNEGVQAIWDKVLDSVVTLEAFKDKVNYERIGVKFLQEDGKGMIEVVLKRENGSYIFESFYGDLFNVETLVPAVQKLVK